jgi:phosphate uptake regulator
LKILPPEFDKPEGLGEAFFRVSPKDDLDLLIKKTVSAYLIGYNFIHIVARKGERLSSRQRGTLRKFARRLLIGTEIVTDTSSELILQVLLSYPELPVHSALRRMSIITSAMHRDAMNALKDLDLQLANDVIETDDEVDRFHLYIIRQLKMTIQNPRIIKEIGLENPRDCLGYRLITKTVERTADHAGNIARNVLLLKKQLDKNILTKLEDMSKIAISSFDTVIDSLFRRDFQMAESVILKIKKIVSLEKDAVISLKESETEETTNVRLIIESLRRIAEHTNDIAEIVLNLTVTSEIGETKNP